MEKNFWEKYYRKNREPYPESPFAEFIAPRLKKGQRLIELGCGNGRDAIFFNSLGLDVLGVDQCDQEVAYLTENFSSGKLAFMVADFTQMPLGKKYDHAYSRFTLHSIDEDAEERVLDWAERSLNPSGLFHLEVRSVRDDMFKEGRQISASEAVTDHYRRFSDIEKLTHKLISKGFSIDYSIESTGLAPYGQEDPAVIRIIAKK